MGVLILMGETNNSSWCIRVTSNLDVNKINTDFGTDFTQPNFGDESQQSWNGEDEYMYSLHYDVVKK
jgi:hypothetical protein